MFVRSHRLAASKRLAQPSDFGQELPMRLFHRFAVLATVGLLVGCAGGLPPGGVAALDGVYEGDMTRSGGHPTRCPARYTLRIAIAGGEARGEVFDPQQPGVPADRFMAFVEADGRIVSAIRVGSQNFGIQGRFGTNAFTALVEGPTCAMSAYAARRP